jgi:hypothetical protein
MVEIIHCVLGLVGTARAVPTGSLSQKNRGKNVPVEAPYAEALASSTLPEHRYRGAIDGSRGV